MPMVDMEKGVPFVERFRGDRISIYSEAEIGQVGMVIDPLAAISVAFRLLRAAADIKGGNLPGIHIDRVQIEPMLEADGTEVIRLTFVTDEGAPIPLLTDLTGFAQLTADFAHLSREYDRRKE